MSDSQVEEIKSKTDIVDIISEHVKLTKAGSNFKGLCPFHSEKSPSFMVSSELQIYKCFGCGEGGDVFTFLEKYEGMDFPEALKFLADKVHVVLSRNSSYEFSEKDVLYQINNLAAKLYNYLLTSHMIGKVALAYLKNEREISDDLIRTFSVGFAPGNRNSLSDFLVRKKKFKVSDLEKAGVVFVSKSGRVFDRFEGRIIFPISDHRGNVIALAGRQLPPGKPNTGKYINSPETLIYHKSSSLYGLNITKDFIKKAGFATVVEGEIDLISLYKIGIKNVVAIKGSAFTSEQARLLGRYTKEVRLALDSDFAGVSASMRGIKILEDLEFDVKVVQFGIYKDPDDASKANPDFVRKQIEEAVPVWDFVLKVVVDKYDKKSASGKKKISLELTPMLANIANKIVQEHYIHKLAELLDVSDEAVTEEVYKKKQDLYKPEDEASTSYKENQKTIEQVREERLIALLLVLDWKLLKNEKVIDIIQTPILKRLVVEFKGNAKDLSSELFEKFGELSMSSADYDISRIKNEINELYRLMSKEVALKNYKNVTNKNESQKYKSVYEKFDSYEFEKLV